MIDNNTDDDPEKLAAQAHRFLPAAAAALAGNTTFKKVYLKATTNHRRWNRLHFLRLNFLSLFNVENTHQESNYWQSRVDSTIIVVVKWPNGLLLLPIKDGN